MLKVIMRMAAKSWLLSTATRDLILSLNTSAHKLVPTTTHCVIATEVRAIRSAMTLALKPDRRSSRSIPFRCRQIGDELARITYDGCDAEPTSDV